MLSKIISKSKLPHKLIGERTRPPLSYKHTDLGMAEQACPGYCTYGVGERAS